MLIYKWQILSLYIFTLGHKRYKYVFCFKHYFSSNVFTIIFPYLSFQAKSLSNYICSPGCPTSSLAEDNIKVKFLPSFCLS